MRETIRKRPYALKGTEISGDHSTDECEAALRGRLEEKITEILGNGSLWERKRKDEIDEAIGELGDMIAQYESTIKRASSLYVYTCTVIAALLVVGTILCSKAKVPAAGVVLCVIMLREATIRTRRLKGTGGSIEQPLQRTIIIVLAYATMILSCYILYCTKLIPYEFTWILMPVLIVLSIAMVHADIDRSCIEDKIDEVRQRAKMAQDNLNSYAEKAN